MSGHKSLLFPWWMGERKPAPISKQQAIVDDAADTLHRCAVEIKRLRDAVIAIEVDILQRIKLHREDGRDMHAEECNDILAIIDCHMKEKA